jgi:hypothetical protein
MDVGRAFSIFLSLFFCPSIRNASFARNRSIRHFHLHQLPIRQHLDTGQ